MVGFKSLVVMDLESSGLPVYGGKTKITELSFIGVLVDHIIDSNRVSEGTPRVMPRVLQKLNVCFYPQKCIDFAATEITGLDNFLLEEIPVFNKETGGLLRAFLGRMPSPVCLVAHNGMKFDFPLLKAELVSKNEAFPEDIFCADSLMAFRALFPIVHGSPPQMFESSSHCLPGIRPLNVSSVKGSKDELARRFFIDGSCGTSTAEGFKFEVSDCQSVTDFEKANNTTPKAHKRPECPPPLKRKNDDENENGGVRNSFIRKKLFRGQDKLRSHKLGDLYQYFHGKEQESSHRAENDSTALLECIVTTAPKFLSWIEKNHLHFTRIPCLW